MIKFQKFIYLGMITMFLLGLLYIKVQTEIKKESYILSQKISRMEALQDERYALLSEFYRYASLDTECMAKLGYNFPSPQKLVRIEVPRIYRPQKRGLAFVKKIFSVGATAQAKE